MNGNVSSDRLKKIGEGNADAIFETYMVNEGDVKGPFVDVHAEPIGLRTERALHRHSAVASRGTFKQFSGTSSEQDLETACD